MSLDYGAWASGGIVPPRRDDWLGPFRLDRIYQGDCRMLLMWLPDRSVDITLTSPPYNIGLRYEGYEDLLSEREFKALNRRFLLETYRATCESGRLYVAISHEMLWWFKDMAEQCGWTYVQMLTWCKPNMVSRNSDGSAGITLDWNLTSEPILLFRKGKRTSMLNGGGWGITTHNWFVETVPQTNFNGDLEKQHPAQWPLDLCIKLLGRTPGNVVLDPFCGSGTALMAAKLLDKRYLGIDIAPSSAELARSRVAEMEPRLGLSIDPLQQLALPEVAA